MKKNFYQYITCIAFIASGLCISSNVFAQVTVGSKGVPNAGALLDMKQKDKTDGSANSDKGLGLPRVALTAVDKLDPCVATTGNATKDDTAKKSHIGLTVYNTTDNTSTDATLIEGVYAWDGTMWTQYSGAPAGGAENGLSMNGRKVILGGALNQPTTITGDATNDLTLETPTTIDETLTVTGNESVGGSSTIGMNTTTPTVGALLEIRNKQQDLTGVADVLDPKMVTSDKGGLLLPRVQLVNLASLEPFIAGADAETKLSLAGLMVYNIAVSGDKIYPAFYIWSGTSWTTSQQSASTLVIDNSVEARVKPFTFYELGTETTTSTPVKFEPLKVTVSGAFGTPTYQWYQVTGNNVHIRAGSKIIGATSDTFYPVNGLTFNSEGDILTSESILKGPTRDSRNTGFYKYYCVVSDDYRTVETETVEVAVGCGAKNTNGDWITFMCYNLGSNQPSISSQRTGATSTTSQEQQIFGSLFQWGRIPDGHEIRTNAFINKVLSSADIAPGYFCGGSTGNNMPYQQVATTSSAYGKFVVSGASNWNPLAISGLWSGTGGDNNDPCRHYNSDGTYSSFWITSSTGCARPNLWRMPISDEFNAIYSTVSTSGPIALATANTLTYSSKGIEFSPDNNETTLFLPLAGYRHYAGSIENVGIYGFYWTSVVNSPSAYHVSLTSSGYDISYNAQGTGMTVRCIKNQ